MEEKNTERTDDNVIEMKTERIDDKTIVIKIGPPPRPTDGTPAYHAKGMLEFIGRQAFCDSLGEYVSPSDAETRDDYKAFIDKYIDRYCDNFKLQDRKNALKALCNIEGLTRISCMITPEYIEKALQRQATDEEREIYSSDTTTEEIYQYAETSLLQADDASAPPNIERVKKKVKHTIEYSFGDFCKLFDLISAESREEGYTPTSLSAISQMIVGMTDVERQAFGGQLYNQDFNANNDLVEARLEKVDRELAPVLDSYDTQLRLTGFDRAVYTAAITILLSCSPDYARHSFTAAQVIQIMQGNKYRKNYGAKTIHDVMESLEKLAGTRIHIDVTDQVRKEPSHFETHDKNDYETDVYGRYVYNGFLLPIESITNNSELHAGGVYTFIKYPTLLRYTEKLNQFARIPTGFYAAVFSGTSKDSSVNGTRNTYTLTNYLIRRIEEMKRKRQIKNELQPKDLRIRYSAIYDEIETDRGSNISKDDRARMREDIKKILNAQREAKSIKEYKIIYAKRSSGKDSSTPESIEITLNDSD